MAGRAAPTPPPDAGDTLGWNEEDAAISGMEMDSSPCSSSLTFSRFKSGTLLLGGLAGSPTAVGDSLRLLGRGGRGPGGGGGSVGGLGGTEEEEGGFLRPLFCLSSSRASA